MVIIYVIYLYHKQALFTIVHTSVQMHPGSRNYNNQQFNHQSDLIFIVGLPSSSLLSSWQVNHFRKFSAAAMSGSIWKKKLFNSSNQSVSNAFYLDHWKRISRQDHVLFRIDNFGIGNGSHRIQLFGTIVDGSLSRKQHSDLKNNHISSKIFELFEC